jgi:hypothetical protein
VSTCSADRQIFTPIPKSFNPNHLGLGLGLGFRNRLVFVYRVFHLLCDELRVYIQKQLTQSRGSFSHTAEDGCLFGLSCPGPGIQALSPVDGRWCCDGAPNLYGSVCLHKGASHAQVHSVPNGQTPGFAHPRRLFKLRGLYGERAKSERAKRGRGHRSPLLVTI